MDFKYLNLLKLISNLKTIRESYRDRNPRLYPYAVERQCDGGTDSDPGETLDELSKNLQEAIEMLTEDGEPELESLFIVMVV